MEETLKPAREAINEELDNFFKEVKESVNSGNSIEEETDLATKEIVEIQNKQPEIDMIEEVRRFTLPTMHDEAAEDEGPKRLRPTTVLMAAESGLDFKGVDKAKHLSPFHNKWGSILKSPHLLEDSDQTYKDSLMRLSLSVELLHNFTLIHDDINDGDLERRNVDTTWDRRRQNAEELGLQDGSEKKGIDHGIHDGNLLRTLADSAIYTTEFTDEKKLEMLKVLNEAERNIIYGQNRDLWMEGLDVEELFDDSRAELDEFLMGDYDSPDELYLDMIDKKTVDLFVASVDLGAIAADMEDYQRNHMRRYARNAGIPFQIRDDVLEIENASSMSDVDTNKGSTDIPKGKTTLVAVSAYQNILDKLDEVESEIEGFEEASDALISRKQDLEYHKHALEDKYGDSELSEGEITEVADIIYQHETASDFYEERLEKAEHHLEKADLNGDKEPFIQFGEYLKERDR